MSENPIRIGYVDDNAGNRHILREKLAHTSIQVVLVAENGKDFLEKMKALPADRVPSIVLMDLEMPEMDGVDAVAAGSYLYPSVKFVMLTIFDDEDRIFNAIRCVSIIIPCSSISSKVSFRITTAGVAGSDAGSISSISG